MKFLLLLPLLLWSQFTIPKWGGAIASSAPSPFTIVQKVSDDAGVLTVAATTAGNANIVCYGYLGTTGQTVAIGDNATGGSNTYTSRATSIATNAAATFQTGCFDSLTTAHGGATTISMTTVPTSGYTVMWFYEVHRTSGTWTFDLGAATAGASPTCTGTNCPGPSIAMTGAPGFGVAGYLVNDTLTANPASGNAYNAGAITSPNGNGANSIIAASSGTQQSAVTDNTSGDPYCASAVAYK